MTSAKIFQAEVTSSSLRQEHLDVRNHKKTRLARARGGTVDMRSDHVVS